MSAFPDQSASRPPVAPAADASSRGHAAAGAAGDRVLLALDKFKGTLDATGVVASLAEGIAERAPHLGVDRLPVADGGEGTLALLATAMGLRLVERTVHGATGERVRAEFGEDAERALAVVELARAAGLEMVPAGRRDPTRSTTFGVGELVRAAIDRGAQRVIVTLGGSATCDGGVGLAQALGAICRDRTGALLPAPLRGGDLTKIAAVEPVRLSERSGLAVRLEAAVDVEAPLLGPHGAARRFAPQKGATPAQVEQLERGLEALAAAVAAAGRERGGGARASSSESLQRIPGSGAAGGCGFGLMALCGATLRPGAAMVLEALRFDDHLRHARLVVTGEGRFDASSMAGKASVAVARAAAAQGVPTLLVAGALDDAAPPEQRGPHAEPLFAERVSLTQRFGQRSAMQETAACLRIIGREIADRLDAWQRR